jgi:hypothetical protein
MALLCAAFWMKSGQKPHLGKLLTFAFTLRKHPRPWRELESPSFFDSTARHSVHYALLNGLE